MLTRALANRVNRNVSNEIFQKITSAETLRLHYADVVVVAVLLLHVARASCRCAKMCKQSRKKAVQKLQATRSG